MSEVNSDVYHNEKNEVNSNVFLKSFSVLFCIFWWQQIVGFQRCMILTLLYNIFRLRILDNNLTHSSTGSGSRIYNVWVWCWCDKLRALTTIFIILYTRDNTDKGSCSFSLHSEITTPQLASEGLSKHN